MKIDLIEMDYPFVVPCNSGRGYQLVFSLPDAFYQQILRNMSKIEQSHFDKLSEAIARRHEIDKPYPKLLWGNPTSSRENNDSFLWGMKLGDDCACVGFNDEMTRNWYFHNVDFSGQAFSALQILSTWVNHVLWTSDERNA